MPVVPVPAPTVMEREIIEEGRATLDIKFKTDKADIQPQYHAELATFGDIMKKHPDLKVIIEGHTDNVGTAAYNKKLSQRRADSVKRYMTEKFGIEASRLKAKGYGLSVPIASNATAAGKAKNRRVEAVVEYMDKKIIKQ
jgi:OOP family OmpA-OmpF porin